MNIENNHLGHIFVSTLFREKLMHLPFDFILTELWHLLDLSAVVGHGAVLAALLLVWDYKEKKKKNRKITFYQILLTLINWSLSI